MAGVHGLKERRSFRATDFAKEQPIRSEAEARLQQVLNCHLGICGKTRAGRFLVVRKSRADRMRAKLKEIKGEMRRMMHLPIAEQGKRLCQVLSGWLAYHAVPTNFRALQVFRDQVTKRWRRRLSRRSQRGGITWERMRKIAEEWLPRPRILHPWPRARFAVNHQR